jgi:hypothetical protein
VSFITITKFRVTPDSGVIKPYEKNQSESSSEVYTINNGPEINLEEFEAKIRQECEEDYENKFTAVLKEAEEIHEYSNIKLIL